MFENFFVQHVGNFVATHQQLFTGFAAGFILANPILCATILFNFVTKIPGVGPWIAKNPDKAKGWFDPFAKKIDDLVDKYAIDAKGPPPTADQPK